jgi:hypothetical protein
VSRTCTGGGPEGTERDKRTEKIYIFEGQIAENAPNLMKTLINTSNKDNKLQVG